MYVLTNGSHYCSKTSTNKITGTNNIGNAFKYETEEEAIEDINRATSKLKNYKIKEIGTEINIVKKSNINTQHNKRIRFESPVRVQIYRKSEGHCCLCGNFVDYDSFTVDHIIPLAKGGTNDFDNLQCACKVCNSIKTDVLPNEFIDKITEMISYNMYQKYNKSLGKRLIKLLIKSNLHRIIK